MNKKEKYLIWSLCCKCNYEWKPRVKNPKSCPRCKARLDLKPINNKLNKQNANRN